MRARAAMATSSGSSRPPAACKAATKPHVAGAIRCPDSARRTDICWRSTSSTCHQEPSMRRIAAALAMIATVGWSAAVQAQSYPVRPVRLIVPFPAGGPVDVMGRLIAQSLSGTLGQQVVVDNRPGAGSTLAGREAARAEPDGYTLLLGSAATLAIGPALFKNIGYDPVKSFIPVAFMSSVPYVMVAGPKAPASTVKDVIV